MFQQLRQLLSIHGHLQPSNRMTPSHNRHINSLPTELLIMIFQVCCDYCDYGPAYGPIFPYPTSNPILLSLVCRFWHAIVTTCPALWTTITFAPCKSYRGGYYFKRRPIFCRDWPYLQRALWRAGTATLSLKFRINGKEYPHNNEQRVLRLFGRCRNLSIDLMNADAYTFASPLTMPHLEHLTLDAYGNSHIEQILDSIERRSPLFRSLSILGPIPTDLARHKSLLRRIVRLDLFSRLNSDKFFQELQNLEELTIYDFPYRYSIAIEFFFSEFPKLVSLRISGHTALPIIEHVMTLPLLESLELGRTWEILQFIAAPKLRNLILTNRHGEELEGETISALLQSTVRPMSLSIDFISDASLPELLKLWSTLSELKLHGSGNNCVPGAITTAALAGNRRMEPYCSSLRYLTVHVEDGQKDSKTVNQSIRRLTSIVKKRKGYGVVGLQRVMCVWNWGERNRYRRVSSEVEWVDVI